MKNQFKVSELLIPYIKKVMVRRNIMFNIMTVDGQKYFKTNLSGSKFHKIVVRANCERLQEEKHIPEGTCVYARSEIDDKDFQNEYNAESYSFVLKNSLN